jgi:YHS domain-containing protein
MFALNLSMKKVFFILLTIVVGCSTTTNEIFVNGKGVAASGYDVVGYFKESKAVLGSAEFQYEWNGAVWQFAGEENLETFKSNPEGYAPQYGGYCAYGTADGHKASTEPDAWKIVDNKLYLNYNKDVQSIWLKNQTNFIQKANANWPEVKKQSY